MRGDNLSASESPRAPANNTRYRSTSYTVSERKAGSGDPLVSDKLAVFSLTLPCVNSRAHETTVTGLCWQISTFNASHVRVKGR